MPTQMRTAQRILKFGYQTYGNRVCQESAKFLRLNTTKSATKVF